MLGVVHYVAGGRGVEGWHWASGIEKQYTPHAIDRLFGLYRVAYSNKHLRLFVPIVYVKSRCRFADRSTPMQSHPYNAFCSRQSHSSSSTEVLVRPTLKIFGLSVLSRLFPMDTRKSSCICGTSVIHTEAQKERIQTKDVNKREDTYARREHL